jgi:hypothetical protein
LAENGDTTINANNIKPVCEIVEYANKRFNRFWYNADNEPTAIDKTLANKKNGVQNSLKSTKTRRKSLIITLKITIFGSVAKSKVTLIIAPS